MKYFLLIILFITSCSYSQEQNIVFPYTILVQSPFVRSNPIIDIYESSNLLSNVIFWVNENDTIEIIGIDHGWYQIKTKENKIGFMQFSQLKVPYELDLYRKSHYENQVNEESKKKRLIEEKEKENKRLKESRIRKSELIKKYGNVTGILVFERKIQLGFTTEMTIDSWGKPDKINRDVGVWGVHEQWIYGNTYVYFEKGILTSWQER